MDRAFISQGYPEFLENKFYIVCKTQIHLAKISSVKEKIEEKLFEKYGKDFELFIIMQSEYDKISSQFDMSDIERERKKNEEEIESKINIDVIWD